MTLTQDQVIGALSRAREMAKIGITTGRWAVNKEGKSVDPWSEEACAWCTEGLFMGATHFDENSQELQDACVTLFQTANKEFMGTYSNRMKILKAKNGGSRINSSSIIPSIHDTVYQTQANVIKALNNAIQLAKRATWK